MRDFGDQLVSPQQLQLTTDPQTPASPFFRGDRSGSIEFADQVAIAKAVQSPVAAQDGAEESLLVGMQQVEPASATVAELGRPTDAVELLRRGARAVDDAQGVQVPRVGGAGLGVVLVEIGHAFIHRTPDHLPSSAAQPTATNAKLPRLIDDRLDPQDLAELVVHFQPVVFHPVLDAGAGKTILLAVGEHLAVEVGMPSATEKGQDVVGRELEQRMVEQPRIEFAQRDAIAEQDVGAVLGLVDDPVVVGLAEPGGVHQGIDATGPAIEDFDPGELGEAIGEALGGGGIVELGEGVVALNEAELAAVHLPGEPVVAVDVDLDGEGKPGLDADVHQSELGIEEVVVEDALRPRGEGEPGPIFALKEFDGAAGFHDLKHGDEAFALWTLAEQFLDEWFLLGFAGEPLEGNAGLVGFGLSMIDEGLRLLLDEGEKIFAAHLEAVIDPAIKMVVAAEGQVPLENDSVVAAEGGYNRVGEFRREVRRHGVLLPEGGTPGIANAMSISALRLRRRPR